METKKFHIGDVLTITSGRLVSPRHVEGIYDICGWMTGSQPMTHQLPRVSREIEGDLRRQHPALAAVDVPSGLNSEAKVVEFLSTLYETYGEYVEVSPIPAEDHTEIDPISEIRMINPNAQIISI